MRWFHRRDYLRRRGSYLQIGTRNYLTTEGRLAVLVVAGGVMWMAWLGWGGL